MIVVHPSTLANFPLRVLIDLYASMGLVLWCHRTKSGTNQLCLRSLPSSEDQAIEYNPVAIASREIFLITDAPGNSITGVIPDTESPNSRKPD